MFTSVSLAPADKKRYGSDDDDDDDDDLDLSDMSDEGLDGDDSGRAWNPRRRTGSSAVVVVKYSSILKLGPFVFPDGSGGEDDEEEEEQGAKASKAPEQLATSTLEELAGGADDLVEDLELSGDEDD